MIRNVRTRSKSCPVVWILIDCFCSVAGCTSDCVTNFEPDTTFPALVQATRVFFEKSWKIQKSLKKALAWSWRQLSATEGCFSNLCGWRNVLCHFLPSTINKTEFDSVQTHVLNENPKNPSKNYHCKSSILPLYRRQTQEAFIFQQNGPGRPSWGQTRQIPRFKKIAGRGHKFWTPLELWILILNSSRQQF